MKEPGQAMTNAYGTAPFGDLVVTAFDEAAHYSADPREVSRLAVQAVLQMLRHAPLIPTKKNTAGSLH